MRWRNTLVLMLGVVAPRRSGLYPLMPPRLMPARYGFVDTAAEFFNFGPQVTRAPRARRAADRGRRPHVRQPVRGDAEPARRLVDVVGVGGVAVAAAARGRRCCWALYPVTIFFCIVVTANHWILDAVGGWVVLAVGYAVASLLAKRRRPVAVASHRP